MDELHRHYASESQSQNNKREKGKKTHIYDSVI